MHEMIEVKTSELTGAALDWAVAQIDEVKTIMMNVRQSEQKKPFALFGSLALPLASEQGYAPSSCWHCGGPLIEKFQLDLTFERKGTIYAYPCNDDGLPDTSRQTDEYGSYAQTYLVAACRAIVAKQLGEVVSVPAELAPLNPA